jgi:hypothetical protein
LLTAVPFSAGGVLADAQPLPHGRSRAGDRHLNFYKIRDNLGRTGYRGSVAGAMPTAGHRASNRGQTHMRACQRA